MNTFSHLPPYDNLPPESRVLLHIIQSRSLAAIQEYLAISPEHPQLKCFFAGNFSAWDYITSDREGSSYPATYLSHSLVNNDIPRENTEAHQALRQDVAKKLYHILGNPFDNLIDTTQNQEAISHNAKISNWKRLLAIHQETPFPDPKDVARNEQAFFHNPEKLLPWLYQNKHSHISKLFYTSQAHSSPFVNEMVFNALQEPQTLKHIDDIYNETGIHPISYAIEADNLALAKHYFDLGVSPNLLVARSPDSKHYGIHDYQYLTPFQKSSILTLCCTVQMTNLLFEYGASIEGLYYNQPEEKNMHAIIAKNLKNTSNKDEYLAILDAVNKHQISPDKDINHFDEVCIATDMTGFKSIYSKFPPDLPFKERVTPNAYRTSAARLAAADFMDKANYIPLRQVIAKNQDKLSNGQTHLEHILLSISCNSFNLERAHNKDKGPKAKTYQALGSLLEKTPAWKYTFPDTLYSGTPTSEDLKPFIHFLHEISKNKNSDLYRSKIPTDHNSQGWFANIFLISTQARNTKVDGITIGAHIAKDYLDSIIPIWNKANTPNSRDIVSQHGQLVHTYFEQMRHEIKIGQHENNPEEYTEIFEKNAQKYSLVEKEALLHYLIVMKKASDPITTTLISQGARIKVDHMSNFLNYFVGEKTQTIIQQHLLKNDNITTPISHKRKSL